MSHGLIAITSCFLCIKKLILQPRLRLQTLIKNFGRNPFYLIEIQITKNNGNSNILFIHIIQLLHVRLSFSSTQQYYCKLNNKDGINLGYSRRGTTLLVKSTQYVARRHRCVIINTNSGPCGIICLQRSLRARENCQL